MTRPWLIAIVLLVAAPAAAQDPAPPAMTWSDAIGVLAAERTRATFCVSMLKRYGDPAAVAQGEVGYTEAKADVDGVIAGLSAALAQRDAPAAFTDLQAGLERGFAERKAFCEQALALVPDVQTGTKSLLSDALTAVIGPLIEAAKDLYLNYRDEDALARATINTQLDATRWPAFSAVQP